MSMVDAITQMAAKLRGVTVDGESLRVYSAAERGENGIPDGVNQFPCALVFPGQTIDYTLRQGAAAGPNGQESHTFEVHVQLLEAAYELGDRTANALPLIDSVIDELAGEIGLLDSNGARKATYALFKRQSGLVDIDYGGETYSGYDLVFQVKTNRTQSISLD